MRNFDERKKEIFKRSNERIAKRRKAQKTLSLCIPLALCVTVLSVIVVPKIALLNDKNSAHDYIYTTSDVAYTSLEIKNNAIFSTFSKNYKNQADIDKAYKIIASHFADNDCLGTEDFADKDTEPKKENFNSGGYTQDTSKSLSYTITFSSPNGEVLIYTLDKNTIVNNKTGQKITLSDDQLSQLKKALDLK
jgi:hypothetical protein